jgi:hypothetical protein
MLAVCLLDPDSVCGWVEAYAGHGARLDGLGGHHHGRSGRAVCHGGVLARLDGPVAPLDARGLAAGSRVCLGCFMFSLLVICFPGAANVATVLRYISRLDLKYAPNHKHERGHCTVRWRDLEAGWN